MKIKKLTTLCLIHDHPKILLGLKKRGFGEGLWNGFGGKVNLGESIEEGAKREMMEEAGIRVISMQEQGIIQFDFESEDFGIEMHVFRIEKFSGYPVETEEMKPQWFNVDEIPFKVMWPDDIYWFPLFLKGKKFRGRFLFDRPSTSERRAVIVEKSIKKVE